MHASANLSTKSVYPSVLMILLETDTFNCYHTQPSSYLSQLTAMGKSIWAVFCGISEHLQQAKRIGGSGFLVIINPNSCINHAFVIGVDTAMLFISVFILLCKSSNRSFSAFPESRPSFLLRILSAVLNFGLGLVYFGLGLWLVFKKLTTEKTILPLHVWLVNLFQGLMWLVLGLTACFRRQRTSIVITLKFYSIMASVFGGFLCSTSLWAAIVEKEASVDTILDMLVFPGAISLLISSFLGQRYDATDSGDNHDAFYSPLQGDEVETTNWDDDDVTPFAKAGLLSKVTFWWLNPLLRKGKKKTLEQIDIPKLRRRDQAGTCYYEFKELLSRRKPKGSSHSPPVLSTLFLWQWKAISVAGVFALMKVLAMSAGPLILMAFIEVAEGEEAFKNEGYALTAVLFLLKCIESVSERQWFFRMRLIGVRVMSMLSAAIYEKLLRLSSVAKITHGEVVGYVTVDAYRIGEFPYWFHQIWATSLQLCLGLIVLYYCVGVAAIAAVIVIILTVIGNSPLAKLQHKYQFRFMVAQDKMLQAITEALMNMKILKLYAWESHFKRVIEGLRGEEYRWIKAVQIQKAYYVVLFWSSPVLVPVATFGACYVLGIPLDASKVFTFLATVRLIQEPVRQLPDVVGSFIDAWVALNRITRFLEAPEFQSRGRAPIGNPEEGRYSIYIRTTGISWDTGYIRPTLRDMNLTVKPGEKVAICGEVGAGKTTLLATILGEVPNIDGIVRVYGKTAYVSQTAWIQTGTIRENILFGSAMDQHRYQDTLAKCSLIKDLEMLPFGDLTVIGERGVNLSGGQKQRVQLARALYQNADIYLLDDPFSAVDAHTATSLFNDYVMEALSGKTVLLVTHQVDFLPDFDSILIISDGEILRAATYHELLVSSVEFQCLVNAHETAGVQKTNSKPSSFSRNKIPNPEIQKLDTNEQVWGPPGPSSCHCWSHFSGHQYRSMIQLHWEGYSAEVIITVGGTIVTYFSFAVLAFFAWELFFVIIPMIYLIIVLQGYYFASAKELMRITGISKSAIASHVAETAVGAMTIRAFGEERQMSLKNLDLIDKNASPFFHSFAATEWFIERLELICAVVLSASALFMIMLPHKDSASGFIGMALSYGLSLNLVLTATMQNQCLLANMMISVERLEQYMHISCEAAEIIHENRPGPDWPSVGRVEIHDLKVRYRPDAPLVLKGISCIFEGGWKVGIVGRTGSGKTTLINTLFRLVEPSEGKIIVDDVDISKIGLRDLRSHFGIIPQEPVLFGGSVRYNLDPLASHTDKEIWEVLEKCQLKEVVQEKPEGLDSIVVQDGSNWSMGQRQLICLGRALLKRHKVLVLDEATASIDNATDTVIQRIIQTAFADCTVITVAHRIPTVMDCTKVLAMCDGKIVEYDDPRKLMKEERSLFGQLVREYWSHTTNASKGGTTFT
ncbi:Multidrug resistance-associated protein 7 [Ancistrocladus abbreviatus]